MNPVLVCSCTLGFVLLGASCPGQALQYSPNDTGQKKTYDDRGEIGFPSPGQRFYGQDAQHLGTSPAFRDNGDGTVSDLNTGLMWQKTPDFQNRRTWTQAAPYASSLRLAGHGDWRVPSIKELYSLIDFRGDIKAQPRVPYIDTRFFDFQYPDPSTGLREIDAQYWSSTAYVGTTMGGAATAFGVNFADGRIKGYPTGTGPGGVPLARYVRCVRGGNGYGVNRFVDHGDGTIYDQSTGLMWAKTDSPTALNWEQALAYAEGFRLAGHADWRVPNAKELQSLVDYSRAPDAISPAQRGPAIDPIFDLTVDESWCWSSTTHLDASMPGNSAAVYICFGQAFGWMQQPPNSGNYVRMNVHGAGAQRSDPKSGNPAQYPHGRGPQGDEIRIFNYVRCVRGGVGTALAADAYTLSASSGGLLSLSLDAGAANAGRPYLVLGSLGVTRPGIVLPGGATLPLELDAFLVVTLLAPNNPVLGNFLGQLDGSGRATARFDTLGTMQPGWPGATMSFAYLLYDRWDFASNPIAIDIED